MFLVSRGLSWVNSEERLWGSDSPVREELSTFTQTAVGERETVRDMETFYSLKSGNHNHEFFSCNRQNRRTRKRSKDGEDIERRLREA